MPVAFHSSFQLFSTDNAETFQFPRTCMHTFDVDAKVLHNDQPAQFDPLWHVYLDPKRGVMTGVTKSSVLLLPSLNLLHQSNIAVHCEDCHHIQA
jgi:hypothetical protein